MGEGKVLTDASTLLYFEVGSIGSVPEGFEELFVEKLDAVRVSEKGILVPSVDQTDPLFRPDLADKSEDQDHSSPELAYKITKFLHSHRDVLFARFFNSRELRRPLQIFKDFGDIGLVALDFSVTPEGETSSHFEQEIRQEGYSGSLKLVRALDLSGFMQSSIEKPEEEEGIVVIELDGSKSPIELVEEVHYQLDDRHLIPKRAGEG